MELQRLRTMAAVGLLAASLTACGGSATKQSTGEHLDDGMISAKVKTTLYNDQEVKGSSVNVDTFKGVVQLSGFVRSDGERVRAGELARGVAGVSEVRNDLQVRGN